MPIAAALGLPIDTRDWLWADQSWEDRPIEEIQQVFEEVRTRPLIGWWAGIEGGAARRLPRPRRRRPALAARRPVGPSERGRTGAVGRRRRRSGAHVVVAHGGTNSTIVASLLGVEPEPWEWERFSMGHASAAVLTTAPVAGAHLWSLRALGDATHLHVTDRTRKRRSSHHAGGPTGVSGLAPAAPTAAASARRRWRSSPPSRSPSSRSDSEVRRQAAPRPAPQRLDRGERRWAADRRRMPTVSRTPWAASSMPATSIDDVVAVRLAHHHGHAHDRPRAGQDHQHDENDGVDASDASRIAARPAAVRPATATASFSAAFRHGDAAFDVGPLVVGHGTSSVPRSSGPDSSARLPPPSTPHATP